MDATLLFFQLQHLSVPRRTPSRQHVLLLAQSRISLQTLQPTQLHTSDIATQLAIAAVTAPLEGVSCRTEILRFVVLARRDETQLCAALHLRRQTDNRRWSAHVW